MAGYDCQCVVCGYFNKNLYLEETEGWLECIQCGTTYIVSEPYQSFAKAEEGRSISAVIVAEPVTKEGGVETEEVYLQNVS